MDRIVKISVIVPCYNACAFLDRTIASVLAQDTGEWELVLVDDGSTDSTSEIIKHHCIGDSRIRRCWQENSGRANACNLGAIQSSTDAKYLFFLDSDDQLVPEALRKMSDYLETHPEVCLLGCQFQEIDAQGRAYGSVKRSRWVPGRFFPRELSDDEQETPFVTFFCGTGQGPFAMIRKSVFQKTTGWEKSLSRLSAHEDTDMFCQMALLGIVQYLPERLYLKRVHPSSVVHQLDRVNNAYRLFRRKWDNYRTEDPSQKEILRKALQHYYTRHKPFRDLKIAKMAAADFFRQPSMAGFKWLISLLTSSIKGLLSK